MSISVVEGQENWLFLERNGPHAPLRSAADLSAWRTEMLPGVAANYTARCRRVRGRGLPFLLVLVPESSSIYPEYLPLDRMVEQPSVGETLAERLRAEGIDVVCPAMELRAAKKTVPVYIPHDSHWSVYGAYICYQAIMRVSRCNLPVSPLDPETLRFGERTGFCDLGIHITPERSGRIPTVDVSGPRPEVVRSSNDQKLYSFRQTRFVGGTGRLLLFRDSSANALLPYLERTFEEVIAISPSPAMPDDAIDHFQPDMVMLELGESALFTREEAFADWDTRSFDDLLVDLYTDHRTDPAARLQHKALDALTLGEYHAAVSAAAVGVALAGARPRIHNLAWALLCAEHFHEGYELTSHYARQSSSRFLHYLRSQHAHHLGKRDDALWAISKALELQPCNAQYLYSLAEMHYEAGRYLDALDAVQRSLRVAPLYPRSWSIARTCLRRLERLDEAEACRLESEAVLGPHAVAANEAEDETASPMPP